jgi:class 3 adenylate cyclase/tetratricopeptide (TPR) repeat protein
MMKEIAGWLDALSMSEYTDRFVANGIDLSVLPDLTDSDLEKLGVLLGHRRKMLRAIAQLHGVAPATTVAPSAPHDRAERRQLTLMFCDLVDSTALSIRLDPEELKRIIGEYQRRCAEVIVKSDGFIARFLGDGILAYFGYPQAHEDDAERAVRAGLALTAVVPKLDDGTGLPLHVRVGIATGVVVVGELIGEGPAQEETVVGATPNLAARLQALAAPDTVVIDGNTRRLLGELFEFRSLGPVSIKGFRDAVAPWQVTGAGSIDSRFEALRTTTTPLVGRGEEVELLMRRWRRAKGGEGCVVLICGEPGIGKSHLAQTILDDLRNEPHTRLRYFCSSHHQDSAFYPVITLFERAAGFRREDSVEERLKKLEAVLAPGTSHLDQVAPLLAALLSIPTAGYYTVLDLSPQKQKEKTLDALLAQVEALALRLPLLMVIEDAQWADPTSRDLFDLVVDRVPSLPILVLVTFRQEFTPRWIGLPHVTLLTLNRLANRPSATMIAHLTNGKRLPEEIVNQIIDRTDGIPLFIEELTKTVIESGVLVDSGDRYAVAQPLPPLTIPTTLNASLLARLDRLAPVRQVAQIAAALGRHFSHELISAMAAMPQKQLDDALAQLVSTELVFRRGKPPDAEYTFKHSLVQDAAYNTMLRSNRQLLHARIATTLEGQFSQIVETQPDVLARHYGEAGLVDKALDYSLKAGKQSIARGAMIEAVAHLRKGLDLLTVAPNRTAYLLQELKVQMALGHALLAIKGHAAPEPGEAFSRARQLCEQLIRPAQLGQVLLGQFSLRCVRGELGQAEHHAAEIRHLGDADNDPMWKCFGSSASGCINSFLGNFVDARAYFEHYLSVWDPQYRGFVEAPTDGYVANLLYLSRTLLCLGHLDQARLRFEQALTEARRLSQFNVVFALCNAWYCDWAIHGPKIATTMLSAVEEVSTTARDRGFVVYITIGKIMQGWRLTMIGQASDGIPMLQQGLTGFRATGCKLTLPFFLMTLAEAYGKAEQPEKGLDTLAEAIDLVDLTQERWTEAEMHRLRGTLYISMHREGAAEDAYQLALAIAQRQSATFWAMRAALDLARLWRDQGKRTEAGHLLSPIYSEFTEGFDTPVLQDTKALLSELP